MEKQIVLCNAVTLGGLQQDVESLAKQYAAIAMPAARAEDVTSVPWKPPVKSRYLRCLASCSVSSALNAGSGQADRETRNVPSNSNATIQVQIFVASFHNYVSIPSQRLRGPQGVKHHARILGLQCSPQPAPTKMTKDMSGHVPVQGQQGQGPAEASSASPVEHGTYWHILAHVHALDVE